MRDPRDIGVPILLHIGTLLRYIEVLIYRCAGQY
jgi:hypothetical protein